MYSRTAVIRNFRITALHAEIGFEPMTSRFNKTGGKHVKMMSPTSCGTYPKGYGGDEK